MKHTQPNNIASTSPKKTVENNNQEKNHEKIVSNINMDLEQLEYEEMLMRKNAPNKKMANDNVQTNSERTLVTKPATKKKIGLKSSKPADKEPDTPTKHVETEDMLRLDRHGRTVLHRAALDQNVNLIRELCNRAKVCMDNAIFEFIDKRDKFGNTALINACVAKNENSHENRAKSIIELLKARASPNIRNKRTLWSPLNWCAFHGDVKSIKILLEANANVFWIDYKGSYPIDHCGIQDKQQGESRRREAAELIIAKMKKFITEFDHDEHNLEMSETKYKLNDSYRFIRTPLFRLSALFWAIYFKLDIDKYIKPLIHANDIYPEMPLQNVSSRNCYHACAIIGNMEALQLLSDHEITVERYYRISRTNNIQSKQGQVYHKIEEGFKFFELTKEERTIKHFYTKSFKSYIKKMEAWIIHFHSQAGREVALYNDRLDSLPYFDHQDDLGNTPLHFASFLGHSDIVKYLLDKDVNAEIENKDGWHCQELKLYPNVKKVYKEHFEKKLIQSTREIAEKSSSMIKQDDQSFAVLPKDRSHIADASIMVNGGKSDLNSKPQILKTDLINRKLFFYNEERTIPDVILVFPTTRLRDSKYNDPVINRANFNISLIQIKFQCYMTSGINQNLTYVMIKMDERGLQRLCEANKIRIKLLNDYNYQTFKIRRKNEFEPFRSRQRQEITLSSLNKIVNIAQLKDLNIVENVHLMHTVSGMKKITDIWIKGKRWFLPEPIPSIRDYFREKKTTNFTAVTVLRSYFGEKFSFYFAWVSFYTCQLAWLAIPGLAVYILLLCDSEAKTAALPVWVTYNSLVSTLLVEKWKRKSSEIATRWGTIDLLNKTIEEQPIRQEYSGYEAVCDTTGTITKLSKENHRFILHWISSFILIMLGATVIGSFLLTEKIRTDYPDLTSIEKTLVGSINGVIVAISNFIYEKAARYFVDKENHKYDENYEKSLITKIVLFKALNSYLGVFYLTFIARESFEELFYTLVSLLVTNQCSSLFGALVMPWIQYKYKVVKYFRQMRILARRQWELKKDDKLLTCSDNKEISPEERGNGKKPTNYEYIYKRPVMDCKNGQLSESTWDLMQVELNSLRIEKTDILDYYGNMIVQFGYITMFSPAFALGPLLALVANIFDMKAKIFAFLNLYQRPVAEKAGGIGQWLVAWEVTSIVAIFVNALALFFNLDASLDFLENAFVASSGKDSVDSRYDHNIYRLWTFVIVVNLILVLKFMVMAFINDKPNWVVKREEKQKVEEEKALDMQKDDENIKRSKALGMEHVKSIFLASKNKGKRGGVKKLNAFNKIQKEMSPVKKKESKFIDHIEEEMSERYQKEPEKANEPAETKRSDKNIDFASISKQAYSKKLLSQKQFKAAPVLTINHTIKVMLFNTFNNMERVLFSKRTEDINKYTNSLVVKCYYCREEKSSMVCLKCQDAFCNSCFKRIHAIVNISEHKIVSFGIKEILNLVKLKSSLPGKIEDFESLLTKENANNTKYSVNGWRKFEYFNFPVNLKGNLFFTLKTAFNILYKFYITENSITKENQVTDIEKALKFGKNESQSALKRIEPDGLGVDRLKGVLDLSHISSIEEFMNLEMYNVEEKFMLNRIAFLTFKKKGGQATFDDYLKKVKILEEGSYESKLYLMFDLMDQDDDGFISKTEIENTLRATFLQNFKVNEEIDYILGLLFERLEKIDKKIMFQVGLKNERIRNLFGTLMQVKEA